MKPKIHFEYGGLEVHISDKYSKAWRWKGKELIPPPEAFHFYLTIKRALGIF